MGVKTKEIYDFQRRDSNLADIIDYDQLPHDNLRAKRVLLCQDIYFLDENSLLYHLDVTRKRACKGCHAQLVLPPPLRYEVLVHAHDDLSGGHLGTFKTYKKLRDQESYQQNLLLLAGQIEHICGRKPMSQVSLIRVSF